MPETGQELAQPVDSRDRHIFVWWGVGLGLLLALALSCWLVAGPFLRAKSAVDETCCYIQGHEEYGDFVDAEIRKLGGSRKAAKQLWLYYSAPKAIARNKGAAARMLEHCGPDAAPYFERLLNDSDPHVRTAAAEALKKIRGEEPPK